jgi:hypothetical protein
MGGSQTISPHRNKLTLFRKGVLVILEYLSPASPFFTPMIQRPQVYEGIIPNVV